MSQLARILRFSGKVLSSRKYRNHVLDVVTRHVRAGEEETPSVAAVEVYGPWIRGRRAFLVGGCELSYVKERLEQQGVTVHHSFDHGGASDPLGEVGRPSSPLWDFRPDYVVLSQAQLFRGLVQRLQYDGLAYTREEQLADLDSLVLNFSESIRSIRAKYACPIFVMTYALVYRPAFGVHEYRSIKEASSLAELVRAYELAIYRVAREAAGTYVLDVNLALERVGKNGHLDETVSDGMYEHFTREGGSVLAGQLLYQIEALEPNRPRVKCAVIDLDNTLWTGVLREDGPTGVAVRQGALRVLEELTSRGVILAICSKNDEVEVEHIPTLMGESLWSKVVTRRLNWLPKSENLKSIAKELNIGLDSLALFDDNPFEREEVKTNAPGVLVLRDSDILASLTRSEFEPAGEVTSEASARTKMYVQQNRREESQASAGSLEAFLRTCQLKLTLRPPREGEVSRMHELLARTNQLNATMRRSSLADLQTFVRGRQEYEVCVGLLEDKFGDYGLIGLGIAEKGSERWSVIELAFSCRAMGKGVEEALLHRLAERAGAERATDIAIDFLRTDRNGQVLEILAKAAFGGPPSAPEPGARATYVRRVQAAPESGYPDWLSIQS